MPYKMYYSGGDTLVYLRQEYNDQAFKIHMPHDVVFVKADPDNEVLNINGGFSEVAASTEQFNDHIAFSVYPNPSSDLLNLSFERSTSTGHRITIYGTDGQITYSSLSTNTDYSIDIRDLKPGIYYLTVDSGRKLNGTKFVKVK